MNKIQEMKKEYILFTYFLPTLVNDKIEIYIFITQ